MLLAWSFKLLFTWLKAYLKPLHTILFHNSMSFEFGCGYIVHELVSFLDFREFDNHFSVQKFRFSLSHLLQARL